MKNAVKLKIITPEKLILEEIVDFVSLPTSNGEITILPNHIPLITDLSSGDVVAFADEEHIPITVVGGFVEVKQNEDKLTEVAVLADFAEHLSELTEEKILEAQNKAIELKKQMENKDDVDFEHFETELERSLTRIKIADKWRNKKYRK